MSLNLIIVIIFITIIAFIFLSPVTPNENVTLISLVSIMFGLIYLSTFKNKQNGSESNSLNNENDLASLDIPVEKISDDEQSPTESSEESSFVHGRIAGLQNNMVEQIKDMKEETAPDVYTLDTDEGYYSKYGTPQEGDLAGGDQFHKYYFGRFGSNPEYTTCYKGPSWELNNCNMYSSMPIDEKIAHQSKMRNKENRVLDGWTTKSLNYYKKNFADELDLEENLRWWGRNEY